MHPHVALLVNAKLEKLLRAGFIRAIDYAEWISNIVPVSKHDKSIRVCTHFLYLNLACPKDDFPLPNIDMIMDMTMGYEMYSLMDGSLGITKSRLHQRIKRKLPLHVPGAPFARMLCLLDSKMLVQHIKGPLLQSSMT